MTKTITDIYECEHDLSRRTRQYPDAERHEATIPPNCVRCNEPMELVRRAIRTNNPEPVA